MAKKFYTIDEAAQALGISTDEVQEMADAGKLQSFRDRDNIMFKREQVDKLAGTEESGDTGAAASSDSGSGEEAIDLSETGDDEEDNTLAGEDVGQSLEEIETGLPLSDPEDQQEEAPLSGSGLEFDIDTAEDEEPSPAENEQGQSAAGAELGDVAPAADSPGDAIDLESDEAQAPANTEQEDQREATGVSVFDADEVEQADPKAETQVESPAVDDEELALESVASGSGLLDLTRESDDTSLGAELLDEIYPSGEESEGDAGGGSSQAGIEAPTTGSGFVGETDEESEGTGSGLIDDGDAGPGADTGELTALEDEGAPVGSGGPASAMAAAPEAYDPVGSGLSSGLLLGANASLIVAMVVAISALAQSPSGLTDALSSGPNAPFFYLGGMIVGSAIFGAIGGFLGKKFS